MAYEHEEERIESRILGGTCVEESTSSNGFLLGGGPMDGKSSNEIGEGSESIPIG